MKLIPLYFLLGVSLNSAYAQQRQDIPVASQLLESVFLIVRVDSGKTRPLGTGFFVTRDGLMVTSDHVILDEDSDHVYDSLYAWWRPLKNVRTQIYGLKVERRLGIETPYRDIALLRINNDENPGGFPFLNVNSGQVEVGEAVMIGGCPTVFNQPRTLPLVRRGMVASLAYDFDDSPLIVLDLAGVEGYSGAPIVSLITQQVIGVFKGRPKRDQNNLPGEAPTDFSTAFPLTVEDLQ